jgi:Protein of unknown function (DUF4019)
MRCKVRAVAAITLIALAIAVVQPARADKPSTAPNPKVRVVNVTADSAPGWLPSTDQARAATDAVLGYLAARDAGHAEAAYAMLEDDDKALQPFSDFSRDLASFNSRAGVVSERRIVTVTWTKDPAEAPKPGVYAAIDVISRFANIDRDCGYVVVYQSPAGGPFRVTREEVNFITNADAINIERQQSRAAMEAQWAQLSAECPNYSGEVAPASSTPLPEQANSIGYPTVAAALIDLRSKPGVAFKTENGWTIATDDASHTIWVFASEGQPAYPAAVRRQFVKDPDGGTRLKMSVLCEASKVDCDNLTRTFEALNARMTAEPRGGR